MPRQWCPIDDRRRPPERADGFLLTRAARGLTSEPRPAPGSSTILTSDLHRLEQAVAAVAAPRVPAVDDEAEIAAGCLAVGATLGTQAGTLVAHLTGAQPVAVPQPPPVAGAAPRPQRITVERVGKVAHAVGVLVDLNPRNVAAGDADPQGRERRCLRGERCGLVAVPLRQAEVTRGQGIDARCQGADPRIGSNSLLEPGLDQDIGEDLRHVRHDRC